MLIKILKTFNTKIVGDRSIPYLLVEHKMLNTLNVIDCINLNIINILHNVTKPISKSTPTTGDKIM